MQVCIDCKTYTQQQTIVITIIDLGINQQTIYSLRTDTMRRVSNSIKYWAAGYLFLLGL